MRPSLLMLGVLLAGAAGAAPAVQYESADLVGLAHSPLVESERRAASGRLKHAQWDALADQVRGWREQVSSDALSYEFLLHEAVVGLRGAEPAAPTRAAVTMLTAHAPRAFVHDREHGRAAIVPAFRIAAAARGTLRIWQRRENARRYGPALAEGRMPDEPVDAAALADAIGTLPLPLLPAAASIAERLPTAALASLCRRYPDAALFRVLLRRPADADVQRMLGATALLGTTDAFDLLRTAAQRPDLASAAILAMGALRADDPAVAAHLLATLGDPVRGASAAAALARRGHPAVQRMAGIVARGQDGLAARHAALGLHLAGGTDARAALQALADDRRYPDAVRRQVASWLR